MPRIVTLGAATFLCIVLAAGVGFGQTPTPADAKAVEAAVLAVNAEMTKAGEALDADRLFSFMMENDKGSIIQNGALALTRAEALDQMRNNLRRIAAIQYRWKSQFVKVLSPEIALLTAVGESIVTTTDGGGFAAPFAQTVVFVRDGGTWKVLHAHQSSPRR